MATSEWIQFFREAGIPPGPAVSYAVAFVDNRIHKHMLLDLTKELMHELGITLVGDVIAILKHAKVAYRQEMCRAATEALPPPSAPPEPRRCANSAAGRMIANSLSRDPSSISITVANRSSPPVPPKQRRIAADAAPRPRRSPAPPAPPRTSVFERLGAETELSKPAVGVFGRLGSAPPPSPPPSPEDDDGRPLPYAGVLKKPPPPPPAPRDPPPPSEPPAAAPPPPSEAPPPPPAPQDCRVSSSRRGRPPRGGGAVRLRRVWGGPGARMDGAGGVSVFRRLGRRAL